MDIKVFNEVMEDRGWEGQGKKAIGITYGFVNGFHITLRQFSAIEREIIVSFLESDKKKRKELKKHINKIKKKTKISGFHIIETGVAIKPRERFTTLKKVQFDNIVEEVTSILIKLEIQPIDECPLCEEKGTNISKDLNGIFLPVHQHCYNNWKSQ